MDNQTFHAINLAFTVFLTIAVLTWFVSVLFRLADQLLYQLGIAPLSHQWHYRNPYDRTCERCRRNEVEHGFNLSRDGWWEVFRTGHPGHPCSRKDALSSAVIGETHE